MEIILMRHSITNGNKEHRFTGNTDESLCPEGIARARDAGIRPDIAFAAVSPLKRTSETAEICFPNAKQKVYAGLREMDFGVFDNHTRAELLGDERYLEWEKRGIMAACPGGESAEDVARRAPAAFCEALSDALELGQTEFAVVSHGIAIAAIMHVLSGEQPMPLEWLLDNCCGYKITIDEDAWQTDRRFSSFETFERL